MVRNIWRYNVSFASNGGIVVADTKEEAHNMVLKMYRHRDTENNLQIWIWNMVDDEFYDKDFGSVLEIY